MAPAAAPPPAPPPAPVPAAVPAPPALLAGPVSVADTTPPTSRFTRARCARHRCTARIDAAGNRQVRPASTVLRVA